MTHVVTVSMADYGGRVVSPDMFADLGAGGAEFTTDDAGLHAWFTSALTEAQVVAVRDRLTSRDAADQMARAELASLLAAARSATTNPTTEDMHALLVALTAYVLDR